MSLLSAVLQSAADVEVKKHRTLCVELCPQLKDIAEQARTLGFALRERLVECYVHYSPASARHNVDISRAARIRDDYEHLTAEAKEIAKNKDTDDEFIEELRSSLDNVNRAYEFLVGLCAATEASEVITRAAVDYQRADSASAIAKLDDVMDKLYGLQLDGDAGVAVRNIRNVASGRRALYATQLSQEWEEMLGWSERRGVSHVTYSLLVRKGDTPQLLALLQSLHRVRRLHDELAEFAEFFITKIVKCIINKTCDIYTDENVDTIIFSIKFDSSDERRPNFQSVFTNLTAVLEFLQYRMPVTFSDESTLVSVLAQLIGERFFEVLISDCIKCYLPDCDQSYKQYKQFASELDSFNKFLIDAKFTLNDRSALDAYLEDASSILYKKKCDKLISRARRLLSESMSHATLVVSGEGDTGDSSVLNVTEQGKDIVNRPLFLPRCIVSENVRSVLAMIVEHLADGIKLPEQYSSQLVQYIQDIVVMYQTLVPSIYEVNLKDNPLDIALFFNNSFYLAHGLLGSPWRLSLPSNLADTLNTGLAPALTDLRTLGLHYLSHYLRRQKNLILSTVLPSEQVIWDYDSYEEFDKAVTSSMKIMQSLRSKWLDVLPTVMYDKSMSTLVEAFCQAILNKILSTGNGSVDEALIFMMATRIRALAEEIKTLYKDQVDLAATISIWKKFSKMPEVLTAEMLEITTLWDNDTGPLAQAFTCEEIRHIVKIRFPDDASRLRTLAAIQ